MEIKSLIDGVMPSPDQSEQQAVDCVSSANGYASQGCNGGELGGHGDVHYSSLAFLFTALLLQTAGGLCEPRSDLAPVAPLTWRPCLRRTAGYSDEVLRYASKMFATAEKAYPYTSGNTGVATSCKVASTATAPTGSLKLSGFSYVASNPGAIMAALQTGPVVTYFNVKARKRVGGLGLGGWVTGRRRLHVIGEGSSCQPGCSHMLIPPSPPCPNMLQSSFYGYTSGIYAASSCTTETINHAMIIVGYNKTAGVGSADSYWIGELPLL